MKVYINNINVFLQGLAHSNELSLWANDKLSLPEEFTLPKPQYYPKNQLRRLSPFSKVALHCLDIPSALTENFPLVFASRHGDLAKTVKLIKDAAIGEDLSPTQFALSVHNATSGLFGIATNNTAATTTISAGKNTFIEGLVEASMQCQQTKNPVLYCYGDFDVPEEYRPYESHQAARCITLLLTPTKSKESLATAEISLSQSASNKNLETDLSIYFIEHFYAKKTTPLISKNYTLSMDFH